MEWSKNKGQKKKDGQPLRSCLREAMTRFDPGETAAREIKKALALPKKLIHRHSANGSVQQLNHVERGKRLLAPAPQAEYVPVEEAPEAEGQSTKDVWEFCVEDPDKVPIKYRKIDEQKIRKQVAMDKGETRIPGVRVWKSKGIIQRRIQ